MSNGVMLFIFLGVIWSALGYPVGCGFTLEER